MEICILGSNGAMPIPNRYPSCQVLRDGSTHFMIDCGEGSQTRFNLCQIKRSKISHIFISHLHGDHVYGLPGLLSSYNLQGRTDDLYIFGPHGLKAFIRSFLIHSHLNLQYQLYINEHPTDKPNIVARYEGWTISTVPLIHRIPTAGYLFTFNSGKHRIKPESLEKYDLSIEDRKKLVSGEDIHDKNGHPISNSNLTLPPVIKRYAYCSDTRFSNTLIPYVKGVDLLYHESTFTNADGNLAYERYHSTAEEAAKIAKQANVGGLLLGHYSARYTDLSVFQEEASQIFSNVKLAVEGKIFKF